MAATTRNPLRDSSVAPAQPQLGLRERKKLKTRTAIRQATFGLIARQGYEATTVEQIAAAAEVSPSTVFRYFPTKEDIVLTDEYGPVMEAALRARPAGEDPLESIRHVMTHGLRTFIHEEREEVVQRTRLMVEVPAVRARMTETMANTSELLVHALADRTGRDRDDLDVRIFTAAVLGALREVVLYWAARDHQDALIVLVDRALTTVKGGLTL
ncbi:MULTISPECIES: TetR family transcriptional regulator [unclassified Streptomyces]|uniref:TetR/AcrR family transcriptional regulator n=1 Tax=unclassified Streptomyces TaxID=2593676 RepID=UPI002DDC7454|nr:TetR family transcriptional regulator [Streptomyces sp. NBC_01750]WSB00624.1 TetR family transcriptional regulator [Streptomyces sp. NBC_01794]WSD35020.1 TetR family transcriptional regulator [Streptomyces sp. NBC_01750]